jgi:hypothetical protein
MDKALEICKEGKLSIREVARQTGLSHSTIVRRLSGKVGAHAGVGPVTAMTSDMENVLLQHMNDRVERGFGLDSRGLRKLAAHQAALMGITDFKASSGWVAKFKARNEVALRASSSYDRARGAASNPVLLQSFFDLLKGKLLLM